MRLAWLLLLLLGARPPAVFVAATVVIEASEATAELPLLPVRLAGYTADQIAFTGLPRVGAPTVFDAGLDGEGWPRSAPLDVPADGRTRLVAWVDVNRSGHLDTGDRCSPAADPLLVPPGTAMGGPIDLKLTVDRTWVAAGAPLVDGPPPAPTEVIVERPAGVARGTLMVLGFRPEDLEAGLPRQGARAAFEASDPVKSWPTRRRVAIPRGLAVVAILDRDGDGRASGGDSLAVGALPVDGAVRLTLDRQVPGQPAGCSNSPEPKP